MPPSFTHDVVILGAGAAGVAAVEGALAAGAKRIAVVEPGALGGECPNEACVPTKSLLASARRYHSLVRDGERFGVKVRGASFDWGQAIARKDAVVNSITGGGHNIARFLAASGVEHIKAKGVLADAHTVQAGATQLRAKSIVLAVGAAEVEPPIQGLGRTPYFSYSSLLHSKKAPKSISILGGGAVAVEFATLFGYLGIPVALFETAPNILPHEDAEAGLLAAESLRSLGVAVHVNATVMSAQETKRGVRLVFSSGPWPRRSHDSAALLVAAGKRSRLPLVGAEAAGVKLDHHGDAKLGLDMRTNVKHIFVAGDATNGLKFTNTAHMGGFVAGWNAARVGKKSDLRKADWSVVPHVIFAEPELAAIGPTLAELSATRRDLRVFTAPLAVLSRAACDGRRFGFLKVVTDKQGQILSAVAIGERMGEVVHEIAFAMHQGISLFTLMQSLRAFPTYSEIIGMLSEK